MKLTADAILSHRNYDADIASGDLYPLFADD